MFFLLYLLAILPLKTSSLILDPRYQESSAQKVPTYPLYAIDSVGSRKGPTLRPEDAAVIAGAFRHVQATYNPVDLKLLATAARSNSSSFEGAVLYINSDVCSWAEINSSGLLGLGYYYTGQLDKDLDSVDNQVVFHLANNRSEFPATQDEKAPVMLRIGDEVLRIDNITTYGKDGRTQSATVTRGFGGTSISAHQKGVKVFSPAYNGNAYPGRNHRFTFTIDVTTDFSSDRLINHTLDAVEQGYSGSWFDCFSAIQFDARDVGGQKLTLPTDAHTRDQVFQSELFGATAPDKPKREWMWDFKQDKPHTRASVVEANHERLSRVWAQTKAKLGYYPILLGNNIGTSYWPWVGNARSLLQTWSPPKDVPQPVITRPMNGHSLESFVGSELLLKGSPVKAGCPLYANGTTIHYQSERMWETHLNMLLDAAQKQLRMLPMVAQAGCKSIGLEAVGERDMFELFGYSSFLLAVEPNPIGGRSNSTVAFGIPAFYRDDDGARYAKVHDRYYYDLGDPLASAKNATIKNLKVDGYNSYLRVFEKGLAIVNPSKTDDQGVPLPSGDGYTNPESDDPKKIFKTLDVPAKSGFVLLKSA